MSMFLHICKMSKLSDQLVRDGKFTEQNLLPDFFELYKKNILILGFGRVGKALARRCLGFEAKVYVYDPFVETSIIKENNCIPIDFEYYFQHQFKSALDTIFYPILKEEMNTKLYTDIIPEKPKKIRRISTKSEE